MHGEEGASGGVGLRSLEDHRTGASNRGIRAEGARNPFCQGSLKSHGWTGFWQSQMLVFRARSIDPSLSCATPLRPDWSVMTSWGATYSIAMRIESESPLISSEAGAPGGRRDDQP